ncbi:flagellin [Jannaschia sp. KMU-145]|uniref:flagellin n=1 Tax=Jannaschia halovivens TaxID=3388667 RepID=UPI00396B1654
MTISLGSVPARSGDVGATIRERIETLSREMASGQVADRGRAVRSDFSELSRLRHDLGTSLARHTSLARAERWSDGLLSALAANAGEQAALMEQLAVLAGEDSGSGTAAIALAAEDALAAMMARLGGTQDGRAIFANGDAGGPVLPMPDALLADLRVLAATETDPAVLLQTLDDYFGPGGTFETSVMRDFATETVRFPTGQGQSVAIPVDLDDPAIRATLRDTAILAVLPASPASTDPTDRAGLHAVLLERLVENAGGVIATQARIGTVADRLSDGVARVSAEMLSIEASIAEIVGSDPYETASRLQEQISRLESHYAVTARLSRLSLTDYLR